MKFILRFYSFSFSDLESTLIKRTAPLGRKKRKNKEVVGETSVWKLQIVERYVVTYVIFDLWKKNFRMSREEFNELCEQLRAFN